MDMKEKQIIVTLCTSILILGVYSLYVYNKYLAVNPALINNFKFWGKAIIVLMPVAIIAQIIIHIVFAIINKMVTNEDMPTTNDERDKIIELKSTRVSHWIFTLGFILAMGSQAIDMKPWVMFVTLISSGFVSSIVSELTSFYFYRQGV
jgi:hypothetical protein